MFRSALPLAFPSVSIALLLACGSSESGPRSPGGSAASGGAAGSSNAGGSGGQLTGSAGSGTGGSDGSAASASIQMRVASTLAAGAGGQRLLAFSGGGALRPGLESLEYFIQSVQICETMTTSGSGFSNPGGCLELYRGDESQLSYGLDGDWRPLADAARGMSVGFIDLLDASAREALNGRTELSLAHVRSYNYGIITWSLPIKVKATIPLADGTFLYTHDGTTDYETIGADNYRHYYTAPATSLATPPAEKAVVLLPNGGNWFKFQNPLVVTAADIDERRQWVLDLVFNPEGIVKGYAGDGIWQGNLQERDGAGNVARVVNVPMLDLAPIPHRQNEGVVRESYLGSVAVGPHAFDLRLELYSVEGDPSRTVYGVDCKTLVTAGTTTVPPDMSKVSYVATESDGSLTFQSFNRSPIISGFERVAEEFGTTVASIKCAQHDNPAGAEGGAAIVVDSCPSADLDVTFRLVGRRLLDGELPSPPGPADAGADAATPSEGDAGTAADAAADTGL